MVDDLKKITETIMRRADTGDELGLLYGKMGLVVYFFHYARFTGNQTYEDFAMALMDSLQEQLYKCSTIDYGYGLAGIGTGIEYLVQNGFVEADTNEALEDFDVKIADMTALSDRTDGSLLTGISGIGRYFLFRIAGTNAHDVHIRTINCKMELIHITDTLEQMYPVLKKQDVDDALLFLYAMEQTNLYPEKTKRLIGLFSSEGIAGLASNYGRGAPLCAPNAGRARNDDGLMGGLAGIGLHLMSQLDKRHETWMKLL